MVQGFHPQEMAYRFQHSYNQERSLGFRVCTVSHGSTYVGYKEVNQI